jgi:hypothetical protein
MESAAARVDVFLARWVLGRVAPEEAVRLATRAVEDGCNNSAIAVIAGSNAKTRAEIQDELPRVLRAFRTRLPSQAEALKTLVDDCARRIARGDVDPVRGAWAMFDFSVNEDESPEFFDQVRRFVGLASECDNPGPHVAAHRAEIVAEAHAFLRRGGLHLRDADT